jgi:hypothetical protein
MKKPSGPKKLKTSGAYRTGSPDLDIQPREEGSHLVGSRFSHLFCRCSDWPYNTGLRNLSNEREVIAMEGFRCAKCKRPIGKNQASVFHRYEHYHVFCFGNPAGTLRHRAFSGSYPPPSQDPWAPLIENSSTNHHKTRFG